jgi:Uma2 family endonuclease
MAVPVAKPVRWTVREYFRMAEAGLLDDRRVELINGEIIHVAAQATPHRASVTKTSQALLAAFGAGDWVVIQGTLPLGTFSAPDPDFYVLDVPIGTPDHLLPLPILVIEVSDTSYAKDRGPKLRLYARSGIRDYWIINLLGNRVEIYRQPHNPTGKRSGWRYVDVSFHGPGQRISPLARPQIEFAVDALLP